RSAASATNRRSKPCAQRSADNGGCNRFIIRALRAAGNSALCEVLALGVFTLELRERLSISRHYGNGRPVRRRHATAKQQERRDSGERNKTFLHAPSPKYAHAALAADHFNTN